MNPVDFEAYWWNLPDDERPDYDDAYAAFKAGYWEGYHTGWKNAKEENE